MKFIQICSKFSPIFHRKKVRQYLRIIYFTTSYNVLKKKFRFYFPYVSLPIVPVMRRKVYKGAHYRNGARNGDVDPFNSASVWLFILSIETFLPVHAGRLARFFDMYHFRADEFRAGVLWKNAFILALVSKLRSFIYLLDPLLSALINLAITDRWPRREAVLKKFRLQLQVGNRQNYWMLI